MWKSKSRQWIIDPLKDSKVVSFSIRKKNRRLIGKFFFFSGKIRVSKGLQVPRPIRFHFQGDEVPRVVSRFDP